MLESPNREIAKSGFALFEVMVALALLTGAVVALAGLFNVSARANRTSRASSLAVILALQKMEQLRGLAWGYGPAGEEWVDLDADISVWPESSGGSGLAASPAGSLLANLPGFADYLDGSGNWVGTGSSPPAGTVYVRRWSIEPLADSPLDTLVLRVVVFLRGTEEGIRSPGVLPRAAAQVTSVRTRRGA